MRTIQTSVPSTVLEQPATRDRFAGQPSVSRLGERLLRAAFDQSGIDQRHTVIDGFDMTRGDGGNSGDFYDRDSGTLLVPGTRVRNELYTQEATKLYIDAARQALEADEGIGPDDITHVVTVSCTGFYQPGPDYMLVRQLGLDPRVQRYHLGFMGCYASFPALRAARSFCEADPDAVVLVVSAELCTLHVRSSNDPDQIIASSVFADGAAAAIVSGTPGAGAGLRLEAFDTALTPVGEADMAWTIGDEGFEMVLSSYVPKIIGEHIHDALGPLFSRQAALAGRPYKDVEYWAVHPGGRSILDKVESNLELRPDQLTPSREILRRYGNMSSATILFILKNILDDSSAESEEQVCAMAFGPGLTVESALMTKLSPDKAGTR
ncbi:type III polyketide synthase [Arthrobacter castelli]|uniref:type III polyketide synthase n=1 Tax=Arthrobacter castelli TaxID=271431 RepID=UPI000423D7DE